MSRVGKLPIPIPAGVRVACQGDLVTVEGPKGRQEYRLPPGIRARVADQVVRVERENDERRTRAFHGLARKLIFNMVTGVSTGFTRTLEIVGVGYRAEAKGNALHLSLGYSHPVVYQLPPEVTAKVDRQTVVTLESSNKQLLGEVAAQIRALRPPEPYKGKGIRYAGEQVRRKAGKAAGAGGR